MKGIKYSQLTIVLFLLFVFVGKTDACSIFSAAKQGTVLAAGNEDWSDPFTQMWVTEKTTNRFGMINIGHPDYQVQTAINEHGLFFDFAAIPEAEGKNLIGKEKAKFSLFSEISATCKNIEEALVYLNKYQYPSAYNQVLMADAQGNSLIVNQDTILLSTSDYQIATNFNTCRLSKGDYDCQRFSIIDDGLSKSDEISVPLFRRLLSNAHQEGPYPTQYSYIFDLKNGIINLYSFHNYENVVVLNVKEELNKGYKMVAFKDLFPIAFEEQYYRNHHRDTLTHKLIDIIKLEGADAGLNIYKKAVENNPEVAGYPFVLLSVASGLLQQSWFEDNNGKVFDYWFYPENILAWNSVDKNDLEDLLKIYNYLEATIPPENPKQYIGTYEMKGLVFYMLDKKEKSKKYFEKTIEVAPSETSNYQRSQVFLREYFEE